MHGIVRLKDTDARLADRSFASTLWDWVKQHNKFILIVIAPTLILGAYLYGFAANQYESEADFMVRSSQETPTIPTGLGQVLGMAGGSSPAQSEAMSVGDYLTSHDAVAELRKSHDLVARFRRPDVDLLSRLQSPDPSAESLLKYYRRHVTVRLNGDTGIMTLSVRAFRPDDAYTLAKVLLDMGEQRVNSLNVRAFGDAVAVARRQLDEAEANVTTTQTLITAFREQNRDIDPPSSGEAQTKLVGGLNEALAQAKATQESLATTIGASSPQYKAMQAKVNALQSQVNSQDSRLTVGHAAIATRLGRYEELKLQQQFAAQRYEAAAAAFEKAREQALRQQLYVVRVVEPNLPQKSLYPARGQLLLTIFLGLLITYGIGWLIAAGVREHAS